MKHSVRIALTLAFIALMAVAVAFISAQGRRVRLQTTCREAVVDILDSATLSFVSEEDIRRYIREDYGVFTGQRIDSVNLRKIEDIIKGKSAVGGCEAYMTKDGILHIEVTQREPMIRFATPSGGFYADVGGVIFPLQGSTLPDIPVVEGNIPISTKEGFKGELTDEKERTWLSGIIEMFQFIRADKFWSKAIKKVQVDEDGLLVLSPKKGSEQFVFGYPYDYTKKFARMEDYYRYIMPERDSGYYKVVDVRYEGRVVCRQSTEKKKRPVKETVEAPKPQEKPKAEEKKKEQTAAPAKTEAGTEAKKPSATPAKKQTATPAKSGTSTQKAATPSKTGTATQKQTQTKSTGSATQKKAATQAKGASQSKAKTASTASKQSSTTQKTGTTASKQGSSKQTQAKGTAQASGKKAASTKTTAKK